MSVFVELLGSKLQGKSGEVDTATALADKYVALYFSAHWCPPCRGFTPELVKLYGKLSDKPFEIVFVSSDKAEGAFNEYYETMPWLALPYADRDRKAALSSKFKVKGIPSLIMLDKDGSVLNKEARSDVDSDPEGLKFPWAPPAIKDVIGTEFVDREGKTVTMESLKGKHLGIYFSAHWCPPCQAFTPKLAETYNKMKAAGKDFEIIFASSDSNQEQFDSYYAEMPWLAVPYSDRERKESLSRVFGITGIPSLVILSPDLSVVSANARGRIGGDPEGNEFPWGPRTLTNIDEDPSDANEFVCVYFVKGNMGDDDANAIMDEMRAQGQKYIDSAASADSREFIFYYSNDTNGGVSSQIVTSFEDAPSGDGPMMILLDIPAGGKYYIHSEASVSAVKEIIDSYKAGSITLSQLQ